MTEIKLRADEARQMASHVKKESELAKDQMTALQVHLGNLRDSFTGMTQQAFEETFQEWKGGSDKMLEGLRSLGEFLETAAGKIQDTDRDIAQQLSR